MKFGIHFIFITCFLLFYSCQTVQERSSLSMELVPLPLSHVNIRVNLPVADLQSGLNSKMPLQLLNGAFGMGKKSQDSLFIDIQRTRKVSLAFRGNALYIAVPVRVSAIVKKRVMGVTLHNEDNPVIFDAVAQLQTRVGLRDDWNLDFECKWKGMLWETTPELNIMGFTINLENFVSEKLAENEEMLESQICGVLNEKIPFSQILNGVYEKLPEPKPIAKKVGPLYLHFLPSAIRGSWIGTAKDTISLQIESEMNISICSQPVPPVGPFALPRRKETLSKKSALSAYVEVLLGVNDMERLASTQLLGQEFRYEGYTTQLKDVGVFTRDQKLCIRTRFEGDLTGSVLVSGKPKLDENLVLTFEEMHYELEEADQWIKLTNMALQSSLESYLNTLVRVDVAPFFGTLSDRIREGIAKGKMGDKLDLDLKLETISLFDQGMDDKSIQFIFLVEGSGEMYLKSGLFDGPANQ